MGQFAFVGCINKHMNKLYREYCISVEDPPVIPKTHYYDSFRLATSNDTFFSAAFYNVACAEYWYASKHDLAGFTAIPKVGNLAVMQWVYKKGFSLSKHDCSSAARHGHLHVLQWLQANGCPCDSYTCAQAAEGGHLEVLKWTRANDCPWRDDTCLGAAKGGHLEVQNGPEQMDAHGPEPMDVHGMKKPLPVPREMATWKWHGGLLTMAALVLWKKRKQQPTQLLLLVPPHPEKEDASNYFNFWLPVFVLLCMVQGRAD
eukprot:Sro62_g035431.1  (259) ;mRNA; f:90377-91153